MRSADLFFALLTTGLAAAMAAILAVGFSVAASETPMDRVNRLIKELETALAEAYHARDFVAVPIRLLQLSSAGASAGKEATNRLNID